MKIDIGKRLFAFVLSTGAALFLVFVTQPSTSSSEQQKSSAGAEITSVHSNQSDQIISVVQGNTSSSDSVGPASVTKTASEKKKTITVPSPAPSRSKVVAAGRIGELIHWSQSQKIFSIGETAALIDVNTGETFNIKRKGGHNHADCEPLTAADTSVMKSLYKTWSWNRRAVVLVVDGQKIAASMAGMPHGSETIAGNSFAGHFDLHFLGSMTHGSSYTKTGIPQVDPDHQAMVRQAAGR